MIVKVAEYKIRKESLEEVLLAIRTFVRAIYREEPETFYEAFRRGESLEFIHLMKFRDRAAEEKHVDAAYTKEFVAVLYPNCEEEPKFTDLAYIE